MKEIAEAIGVHPSTVSREYKRNATRKGGYIDTKAQSMADARRKSGAPHNKKPEALMWRVEQMIQDDQWSPAQISAVLAMEGIKISKQTIYNHIHADRSGKLLAHTRHRGKYDKRHRRDRKQTKATNIPDRVSIHDRPAGADGSQFGHWEMDLIIGKNGYGAILVLVEKSTKFCIIEKLPHGKKAKHVAKAVIRLLYAYKATGVLSITTDNGSEFAAHKEITKAIGAKVYFADSYCSWQKGLVENTNKLIRQYIRKGSDFSKITPLYVKNVMKKLNRRPREKLNFSTPSIEFFKHFS